MKPTKELAKQIWDFYVKIAKTTKANTTVKLHPGITATISSYVYNWSWRYDLEAGHDIESVKLSAEMKKLESLFQDYTITELINDNSSILDKSVKIPIDAFNKEWASLRKQLDAALTRQLYTPDHYSSFKEFWKSICTICDVVETPKKTIRLSDSYYAKLVKGSDFVEVGCQLIPIQTVRDIITAYEELQSPVKK